MWPNFSLARTHLPKSHFSRRGFIFPLVLVSMFFVRPAYSQQADIGWNAASGPVAGYYVYYGSTSGEYTNLLDAGDSTSLMLQDLASQTWYIAVSAYDDNHDAGPLSTELVIDSLSASAGSGGSISPSGSFFLSSGASQTFTITPASGYQVSGVEVDGNSVGAVTSYTLSNISASHTVSVTFSPVSAVFWQNATDLGGGWEWLSWFGYFYTGQSPWIYHLTLGWLYSCGTSADNIWFWDQGMNAFCWTSQTVYPYIYRSSDGAWLFYQEGTSNPPMFYNFNTGQWESD